MEELGQFRHERSKKSIAENPSFFCSETMKKVTFGEGALLMNVLGRDNSIPLAHLRSFILEERIPKDWVKRGEEMSLSLIEEVLGQLRAMDPALGNHPCDTHTKEE